MLLLGINLVSFRFYLIRRCESFAKNIFIDDVIFKKKRNLNLNGKINLNFTFSNKISKITSK